jgi:peptidoglycan hydrolase CwlO-like protein
MANPFDLTADPPRNSDDTRHRLLTADPFPPLAPPTLELPSAVAGTDLNWSPDDDLRREMARLEAGYPAASAPVNGFGHGPYNDAAGLPAAFADSPLLAALATNTNTNDPAALRAENEEMHKLIEEMKLIFEQATSQEEATSRTLNEVRTQVTGLETQIQERDERVALLTSQIAELERHIQESPAAPPPPPTEDELAKLADELEKERCSLSQDRRSLEQDRQQLRDDEEALMKQMREMEVQMARERAEMARQRTDLQRLHAEVRQELDQLQRGDGAMRDRLAQFQRRHQAVFERGNGGPEQLAAVPVAAPAAANGKAEGGFMGRLFGRS